MQCVPFRSDTGCFNASCVGSKQQPGVLKVRYHFLSTALSLEIDEVLAYEACHGQSRAAVAFAQLHCR